MKTEKMISIMQAFNEGKQIEFCEKGKDEWCVVQAPSWNWRDFGYRIKPEPKLHPYTFEELQTCMVEGKIAVREIGYRRIFTITQVMDSMRDCKIILLSNCTQLSYEQLMEGYQWLDGSPCGVIEEE